MAKSKEPIRLDDNSYYCRNNEDEKFVKKMPDNLVKGKKGNNYINFISILSDNSLEELSNNQKNGGILVWPHSFKECKNDLAKLKILECTFDKDGIIQELRTNNLVGFVGNGNIQIEIGTRFCNINGDADYFLYYLLSKVFNLNIVNMEVGGGLLKELDLLVFMFPRLLQEALRQGLFKKYVKRKYNDSNIRGAIDINRHIRLNYPANGRIFYHTREFSYDNHITQLIRHTIEYIKKLPMGTPLLTESKEMEECVRNIVQSTPTYQKGARRTVLGDNRKLISHPYYTKYKELQQLCLAILRNERISHGMQSNKVHGVLIDVAWLWEEYLAIVLKDVGFRHYTNKNGFSLFANVENGELFQKVVPDYLHTNKYVADAKYIPLHRYERLDADRAAAVYYKTIMYMYRFATSKGFLFHPCHNEDIQNKNNEECVVKSDYVIDNGKECHLYKFGMIIPSAKEDFRDFSEEMCNVENNLKNLINENLK